MTRIARFAMVATAAIGFAAPLASASAQGAAKPTVAILYFNNNVFTKDARDYDGLSKGVPDFLVTEMASNPNIRVIERDQVQKLVDEQKLITGGQVDRESAVRIGKLLGAQHMIFGGFMADPKGNFRIDARAVNVETGQIEYTDRVQDKADNVMPLIGQLAAKLNAGMHLPAMPARTGEATQAPAQQMGATQPAAATQLASTSGQAGATQAGAPAASPKLPMKYAVMYGKALDMADKGDKARAVELFGAVLKDFPDFGPAKNGISKLNSKS
jgi:TolB-like protein